MGKRLDLAKNELQKIFYEPAKTLIDRLERVYEYLSIDEKIMLEKLKFSIKLYEIKKGGNNFDDDFERFNQNF